MHPGNAIPTLSWEHRAFYASHHHHILGSMERGKFTNLVVWPASIAFQKPVNTEIAGMTLVGGCHGLKSKQSL